VSTSGDVFSLGITLIEMFTGKSPTDDMFRDGISLHYYVEAALPDKIMEIADSNIWLHDGVNNSNDTRHNKNQGMFVGRYSAWCPLFKAIAHGAIVNERCCYKDACYQR